MERMGTDYLEVKPGNKSNSRRIAWYAFWAGLFFAQQAMVAGLYVFITTTGTGRPTLIGITGAAVSIFTGIAGSAMVFAFGNKTQEVNGTKNEGTGN